MSKKKRQSFAKEFKQGAVKLVIDQGYKISEAARSLGVSEQALGRWVRELRSNSDEAFRGKGELTKEEKRIRELEAQVKRLEQEKDILKKATAFFVKESN